MSAVLDYLKIFDDVKEEPIVEDYRKELAYRLVRRDFEFSYKEILLSKLVGDINITSNEEDELLGVTSAMCLLFNCAEEDINLKYQELFIEGLCHGLFDMIHKEKNLSGSDIDNYAYSFTNLMSTLASRNSVIDNWNDESTFFQELKKNFSDTQIKYFESNYKRQSLVN